MIFKSENVTLAEFVRYASPEQLAERRDEVWAELDEYQTVKATIDDLMTADFDGYVEWVETHVVRQAELDEEVALVKHLRKQVNDMGRGWDSLKDAIKDINNDFF